MDKLLDKNVIT